LLIWITVTTKVHQWSETNLSDDAHVPFGEQSCAWWFLRQITARADTKESESKVCWLPQAR